MAYSKVGLIVLREHFEQRSVEPTYGSFRSLVPLLTPSGPQWTESELETELLEQLAFAPCVYDLITQPVIRYTRDGRPRRYAADIAVQLHATGDDLPARYVIEVKRGENLARNPEAHAPRFEAGRIGAEAAGAAFRVMDESRIRTPYLANARRLARHLATELAEGEENCLELLRGGSPTTVGDAVALLGDHGFAEPDARHVVEHAVANRRTWCDLALPFSDASIVKEHPSGVLECLRADPILMLLLDAPDGGMNR